MQISFANTADEPFEFSALWLGDARFESIDPTPREVTLYRTLGPTPPDGAASAALLWGAAHQCPMQYRPSLERAGFEGDGTDLGEVLFGAILISPSGVTFSVDDHAESWQRVRTPGRMLNLHLDALVDELTAGYGLVIVDECDVPATSFEWAVRATPGRGSDR